MEEKGKSGRMNNYGGGRPPGKMSYRGGRPAALDTGAGVCGQGAPGVGVGAGVGHLEGPAGRPGPQGEAAEGSGPGGAGEPGLSGAGGLRSGTVAVGGGLELRGAAGGSGAAVGRPPLDRVLGPMGPEALKERKRKLRREQYKRDKTSKARRDAVSQRKDRDQEKPGLEEDEPSEEDEENEDVEVQLHPKKVTRKKSEFFALLPTDLKLQLELLRKLILLLEIERISSSLAPEIAFSGSRATLHRYRVKVAAFLRDCDSKHKISPVTFLLDWAQRLVRRDEAAFSDAGLRFSSAADIPTDVRVKLISSKVTSNLLHDRRDPNCRVVGIKHALAVAKEADLHQRRGDIAALERGIGSSKEFATRVLGAVDSNQTVPDLVKKRVRKDSISASDVPDRLEQFLSNAEHSRALPGHETVSVSYGCRKPKFLLKKSKMELVDIFKRENPDVTFSKKLLLREWPPNFLPPSQRDEQRNVCPSHSNFRRCLEGLKKAGTGHNLSKSVREVCSTTLCAAPETVARSPSTWPESCALGKCVSCPKLKIDLPPNPNVQVHFLQWKKGVSSKLDRDGNPKQVYSLFPVQVSVMEGVKMLESFFPKMKIHVYVATHQYQALKIRTESLNVGDLLTIEDYTMNIDVMYAESTTSSHYSANTISFAGYPIAVRFIDPATLKLAKGAILFISVDKKHDFEQVEIFEKRAVEICELNCGQDFLNWNRWSDNCSGQFKSRKTVGKLVKAAEEVLGENTIGESGVTWEFLEANEAKNESDTIGGFSKTALRQTMVRNPDIVIKSAEDMVEVIQKGLEKSLLGSKKYAFVHVEAIPVFERADFVTEIPIKGIQDLHSFSMRDGGILTSQLSCLQCTVSHKCEHCLLRILSVSREGVEEALEERRLLEEQDEDEDDEIEGLEVDSSDDIGSTLGSDEEDDGNSMEEESEEEEEEVESGEDLTDPGSVVWALWGRKRYPAKVVVNADVPEALRSRIRKDDGKSVIVKFYGDDDFSRVTAGKIVKLGETDLDIRWSRSPGIQEKYALALADLR